MSGSDHGPLALGFRTVWALAIGVAVASCSGTTKVGDEPAAADGSNTAAADGSKTAPPSTIALGPVTKGSLREHAAGVAWRFDGDGAPTKIDIGEAEAKGYTVVDLSDEWVPYIFTEKTAGQGDTAENRYRERYIGLANDTVDQWGDTLDAWETNHLELYGIPPTLQVVWDEWQRVDGEIQPCLDEAGFDPAVFSRFKGVIAYKSAGEKKRNRSAAWFRSELAKKMKKAKLDPKAEEGLAAAATHPKTKALYEQWRTAQDEVDVITNAQKRFRCEKLFNGAAGKGTFTPGVYDDETTHALASFERKHDIMGWGHFKDDNVAMLGKGQHDSAHARLLRVIEERVVSAAGIVEDGSAARWKKDFTWKDKSGKAQPLRDLVREATDAAVAALGLQTPESARKRMAELAALGGEGKTFDALLVAVKLPPLPEYYAPNMTLQVTIDRGDVWYDFPYDELGNKKTQPRKRYPHLTLYTVYLDQKIPLVHWRTTIGSWRRELEEGEVVMKYKNSDTGARVWKDIVAGPVWIPPKTTPPDELVKGYYRKGKFRKDVNYPEIGPGYRSAYGLVAAFHIRELKDAEGNVTGEYDNSIRTHGSVDYMSILRRYSHGCHRLYNMDAVRMFSFVLRHRDYVREGQQGVGMRRDLVVEDKTYTMKIDTRGYKYALAQPIPVMVTEGRIVGRRRSPISEAMPIPGKEEEDVMVIDDATGLPAAPPAATPVPPAQAP